jgi:hypothetical protein
VTAQPRSADGRYQSPDPARRYPRAAAAVRALADAARQQQQPAQQPVRPTAKEGP